LTPAIHRDAKKMDPRVKAADDGPRRWIDFIGKTHTFAQIAQNRPHSHFTKRKRIIRNLERLKIRRDPAAVLLYGNGRVG
jgi:hypothetical protein